MEWRSWLQSRRSIRGKLSILLAVAALLLVTVFETRPTALLGLVLVAAAIALLVIDFRRWLARR